MRRLYIFAILSLALVLNFGCRRKTETAPDSSNTGNVRIGLITSASAATETRSVNNAVELAKDEINREGGVNGRQIEIVVEDDKGAADQGTAIVDRLVNQKVHAIIVESRNSTDIAAAKAQQAQIPTISLAAVDTPSTAQGDYLFKIAGTESSQGSQMGNYAANNLHAKIAAIIVEEGSAFGNRLAQSFTSAFASLGGQIVSNQTYSAGATDFKTQLGVIAQTNPDVIYIPGGYAEAAAIVKQAKQAGIKSVMIGSSAWNNPQLFAIGGRDLDGCYITGDFSSDDPTLATRAFTSSYKSRFGSAPDQLAALAYDATKLVADALKRSSGAGGKSLQDALAHTSEFSGMTGLITIGAARNASRPLTIFKLQEGKIYPVFREQS
jgi:branched-chain amino acid transport system substrate-binding protein